MPHSPPDARDAHNEGMLCGGGGPHRIPLRLRLCKVAHGRCAAQVSEACAGAGAGLTRRAVEPGLATTRVGEPPVREFFSEEVNDSRCSGYLHVTWASTALQMAFINNVALSMHNEPYL